MKELGPFALAILVVVFVLWVVLRAFSTPRASSRFRSTAPAMPCGVRGCRLPLRVVARSYVAPVDANDWSERLPTTTLYCVNGHCWEETPSPVYGWEVSRKPELDCGRRHIHGSTCPEGVRCA